MQMFKKKFSLQYLAMKQKPTDTANDKLLICLGFVSIIKLRVYTDKINKNCFPFFISHFCQKSSASSLQKKYD